MKENVCYDVLIDEYGSPKELASVFQESIPEEEYLRCRKQKRRKYIFFAIAGTLLLVGLAILVLFQSLKTEVFVTESIEIIESE